MQQTAFWDPLKHIQQTKNLLFIEILVQNLVILQYKKTHVHIMVT